MVIFRW